MRLSSSIMSFIPRPSVDSDLDAGLKYDFECGTMRLLGSSTEKVEVVGGAVDVCFGGGRTGGAVIGVRDWPECLVSGD